MTAKEAREIARKSRIEQMQKALILAEALDRLCLKKKEHRKIAEIQWQQGN